MAHAIDYIYFVTCISVVAYRVVVGTSVSVGHPNFRGAKCVMHLVNMQGVKSLNIYNSPKDGMSISKNKT